MCRQASVAVILALARHAPRRALWCSQWRCETCAIRQKIGVLRKLRLGVATKRPFPIAEGLIAGIGSEELTEPSTSDWKRGTHQGIQKTSQRIYEVAAVAPRRVGRQHLGVDLLEPGREAHLGALTFGQLYSLLSVCD